jgi:hypothetical protein
MQQENQETVAQPIFQHRACRATGSLFVHKERPFDTKNVYLFMSLAINCSERLLA